MVTNDGTIYFTDQYGGVCAAIPRIDHIEVWPVHSREFRRYAALVISKQINKNGEFKVPTGEAINTFIAECEAKAYEMNIVYSLYNRVCEYEGKIYVDLCNSDWTVAELDKTIGWKVTVPPVPLFRRYSHMRELKIHNEEFDCTKDKFDSYFNEFLISNEYKLLLQVTTIAHFVPGIPHPIIVPSGSHGGSKSTLCEAIRMLVDNSEINLLALPQKHDDLTLLLLHHYAPVFDNVDNLSEWQASALCRASTGEGSTKRMLYTNEDDFVFKYRRAVIVNGMNIPSARADFLDRALIILVDRLDKTQRRRYERVMRELEALAPFVRGYALDTVVKAWQLIEKVEAELQGSLPRLADFCVWGEAISRAMGNEPMLFYKAYMQNINKQHEQVLEGSVVATLLLLWLDKSEEWKSNNRIKISPSVLYKELKALAKLEGYETRQFPNNPAQLTNKLNVLKHTLQESNIKFDKDRTGTARMYIFQNIVTVVTSSQTDDKFYSDEHDNQKT